MLSQLLLVAFLVFANGFFVAAEFALVKVRQSKLEEMENQGNAKAKNALKVAKNLDVYLSACQVGITLASLGLGWVGEPAIAHLIVEPLVGSFITSPDVVKLISFAVAFSVITFLHIVVGEMAPKSLAIQKADNVSLWVAWPLMIFQKITYPIIFVLNSSSNFVLKLCGIQPASEHELAHSEEEIRSLMMQSHKSGHIDEVELNLIEGAFDFAERVVREVMVPRVDMITVNIEDSYEDIIELINREQHTRYPVIKEDKDHIIGFIHIKDMLNTAESFSLETKIRKITTVPESMETSAALKLMQKNRTQIAIVLDEYGGTAGMITMEDLLEEIVGEIRDEFDTEELPPIMEIKNGISVESRVLIEEINDLLGLEINNEEVDTVAGLMYQHSDGKPQVGYSTQIENYLFTIQKMNDNRIERIFIEKVA